MFTISCQLNWRDSLCHFPQDTGIPAHSTSKPCVLDNELGVMSIGNWEFMDTQTHVHEDVEGQFLLLELVRESTHGLHAGQVEGHAVHASRGSVGDDESFDVLECRHSSRGQNDVRAMFGECPRTLLSQTR